ncbi:hypothetical protein [Flammeovirga aprica]|uniref:TonB C-terminal domain-containing protein n=1 Tax=Flammeovirga aprica JL-4 TaxID=694437 RepID=A0A7X9XBJ4_9BACT|nr:hypothetical protein [Flammeovirga aprica]NME70738.1 hypothetical protein [Flammeovirga aprica JL-4]
MNKLIFLYSLILLSFLQSTSYGTPQFPDYLIYQEDTFAIHCNPLESYFEGKERPEFEFLSTACWRGYIAFWEIIDDKLYLIKLENELGDQLDLSFFPDWSYNDIIHADWVSYSILAPYGKKLNYDYNSYSTVCEYEKEFFFKEGVVLEVKDYDNSKSKRSKYTTQLKLLYQFFDENIDYNNINLAVFDSVSKIKIYVRVTDVSEEGKVKEVEILRGADSLINLEAIRVLKSIPEWDVIYQRGKAIPPNYVYPILFKKQ